jgi:hypothetical protein
MAAEDDHKKKIRETDADAVRQWAGTRGDYDWPGLSEQLRHVEVPSHLNSRLLKVTEGSDKVALAARSRPVRFSVLAAASLALVAAIALLAMGGLWVSDWSHGDKSMQASPNDQRDPNAGNESAGLDPNNDIEPQPDPPNDAQFAELERQWADLEIELAVAEQVLEGLQRAREPASTPVRHYEIARDYRIQSTREALAAAMVLSADYEVECGGSAAHTHPAYAQVVRLFPETKWAVVARQHVMLPD